MHKLALLWLQEMLQRLFDDSTPSIHNRAMLTLLMTHYLLHAEPQAALDHFSRPPLSYEQTRLSAQQPSQQHQVLLPSERQSPRHQPQPSLHPAPERHQAFGGAHPSSAIRADEPHLSSGDLAAEMPSKLLPSSQHKPAPASMPPLQGLQARPSGSAPSAEPSSHLSANYQHSTGPSRPASALSEPRPGDAASQAASEPAAARPASALDPEASWPPAIDVNPPAWSNAPSLGLFNSMLPQLSGFNPGGPAAFGGFANNVPAAFGHAHPGLQLEQQRSASLGQHQAILDTLNRAQANVPGQQPTADHGGSMPGQQRAARPSEQLPQGEAAPAENSLLALLQGSIRSLQAGSGGAAAGNTAAALRHALPGGLPCRA